MHTLRAVGLALAILTSTTAARAQEVLSDAGLRWQLMFTVEDVDALDNAAKLSPEQRQAVEDLMQAAMVKCMDLRNAFYETNSQIYRLHPHSEDDAKKAERSRKLAEANRAFMDAVVPIERGSLADLRDLLTPEQATSAWPIYERHRRAQLLPSLAAMGGGANPTSLRHIIKSIGLSEADTAAAAPILDETDLRIDESLKRLIDASRALNRAELADSRSFEVYYESEDPAKKAPEALQRVTDIGKEVTVEYLKACGRLAAAFSPDGRRLLQRARVERERFVPAMTRNWQLQYSFAASYARACKTLTPEQKRAINDLEVAARTAFIDTLLPDLQSRDVALLRGEKWEPSEDRIKACAEAAERMGEQLKKDAQSLLTPEQISEVDYRRPSPEKLRKMFFKPRQPGVYWNQEDEE